ncbi:hypothetical protein ES703_22313 [subsurface metagenome]
MLFLPSYIKNVMPIGSKHFNYLLLTVDIDKVRAITTKNKLAVSDILIREVISFN